MIFLANSYCFFFNILFTFYSNFLFFQPEWFLTQILNWKRDHIPFIETYIEPLLKEYTNDEDFNLKVSYFSNSFENFFFKRVLYGFDSFMPFLLLFIILEMKRCYYTMLYIKSIKIFLLF